MLKLMPMGESEIRPTGIGLMTDLKNRPFAGKLSGSTGAAEYAYLTCARPKSISLQRGNQRR